MVPRQYFEKLVDTDVIGEYRIDIGRMAYRILCFMDSGNLVIFDKRFWQKEPENTTWQNFPSGKI